MQWHGLDQTGPNTILNYLPVQDTQHQDFFILKVVLLTFIRLTVYTIQSQVVMSECYIRLVQIC